MTKNSVFFLVGNYGVGKSTIINEPILSQDGIFIEIRPNLYVLGKTIAGADSLSALKKADVIETIKKNKSKNIIIAGNYYCQISDFEKLKNDFKLVLIMLKTSFENNAQRIAFRGSVINIDTYNSKVKSFLNLIRKTNGMRKLYIVDNNRTISEVKTEIYNIIANETN